RLEAVPESGIGGQDAGVPEGTAGRRWFVDPLDGTTNYAQGLPLFATSIALEEDGRLLVGVVHLPVLDETYTAVQGRGAWKNGVPLHVSATDPLEDALLVSGLADDVSPGRPDHTAHVGTLAGISRGGRG